jgi:hypothetical protein
MVKVCSEGDKTLLRIDKGTQAFPTELEITKRHGFKWVFRQNRITQLELSNGKCRGLELRI